MLTQMLLFFAVNSPKLNFVFSIRISKVFVRIVCDVVGTRREITPQVTIKSSRNTAQVLD